MLVYLYTIYESVREGEMKIMAENPRPPAYGPFLFKD